MNKELSFKSQVPSINKQRGFTLVELLVVMAIIAILATVLLSAFRNSQERSRDAARKSDLKEISQALEMFYSDHRLYPLGNSSSGNILACDWDATAPGECTWGEDEMNDGTTMYFRILPVDPIRSQNYYYRAIKNQQAYQIYAHLENSEDKNCIKDASGPNCGIIIADTDCGDSNDYCNFAITSPNVSATD